MHDIEAWARCIGEIGPDTRRGSNDYGNWGGQEPTTCTPARPNTDHIHPQTPYQRAIDLGMDEATAAEAPPEILWLSTRALTEDEHAHAMTLKPHWELNPSRFVRVL